ncbi:sugar nucleotide-binding protein, partial [Actinoplanes sp. RD1]|uniref:sugar nucleotide-binding protein n=1 Tax=Actinoplanes sp. RD1 TaxID=3064538 RepID=UPI0027405D41
SAAAGARLIHISTDAVHAGRDTPYADDEPPSPVYAYGAAKAAAETAVRAIDPAAALVRTSLIIGDARSKQVTMALELARGTREGFLLADEIRRPIDATDLAAAVLELSATDHAGPINIAGPHDISRADLGRAVAAAHGLDPAAIPVRTTAGSGLGPPSRHPPPRQHPRHQAADHPPPPGRRSPRRPSRWVNSWTRPWPGSRAASTSPSRCGCCSRGSRRRGAW